MQDQPPPLLSLALKKLTDTKKNVHLIFLKTHLTVFKLLFCGHRLLPCESSVYGSFKLLTALSTVSSTISCATSTLLSFSASRLPPPSSGFPGRQFPLPGLGYEVTTPRAVAGRKAGPGSRAQGGGAGKARDHPMVFPGNLQS